MQNKINNAKMPNSVLSLRFVPIVIAMKLKDLASFSVLEPQTSNIKPQTSNLKQLRAMECFIQTESNNDLMEIFRPEWLLKEIVETFHRQMLPHIG